jgi:D-erythronate 2-dehydrogenase
VPFPHDRKKAATIMRILAGWPRAFDARRARALGSQPEADFDEIIKVDIEDELGG